MLLTLYSKSKCDLFEELVVRSTLQNRSSSLIYHSNTAIDSNGGAIKVLEGATVSVEFSTLKKNQGMAGGAIHAEQGCTISVHQSLFSENWAIVEVRVTPCTCKKSQDW